MCGIAGKLFFDPSRHVDPALLARMNEVLAHRGPDDCGIYHRGQVGLAHRRLSIIDLSPAGHQPMSNADGTLWLVFNGEIYNFLELRDELSREGVAFRSKTDSEVILALYEREGVDCLRRLRGMFAFAIWDERKRTLFIARDRLGKKPLYYYADADRFVFASEPKGILVDREISAEADDVAIHHYLTFGYVPSPFCAFKGFHALPPAHYLTVADGRIRVERYWRLGYEPKFTASQDELQERLVHELTESVRLRMISDVPLGAFLSGGIDSSTIVALMSRFSSGPVKTFSIGFEEESHNELPYARMVAELYATDHHEFVVKPDAVEIIPDLVWHYNQPYADSSAIPTYYLAKMTRQHVTVALNGDAGDENFAGYERYAANRLAARYQQLPRALRRSLEAGIAALPDVGSFRGRYRRGKRFFEGVAQEPRRRYAHWVSYFPDAWKAELYSPEFLRRVACHDSVGILADAYDRTGTDDPLDATLGVDVAMYLPDDLLVKVDIASMAHSLEARSPMVDHRFMEFAARIPSRMKLNGTSLKHILKAAVRDLLPREIIDRRKMGFGVPLERWFRGELREMMCDVLLGPRAASRGLFRPAAVEQLVQEHLSGRRDRQAQLWCLLSLELWFQRFIDQPVQ